MAFALAIAGNPAQAQPPELTVLLPAGSRWNYLDDGTDQMTAWREPGFNDTTWKMGFAELGYGDGGEVTVIDCGPAPGNECSPGNPTNKYITTYFRTTFNVTDKSRLSDLSFLHRIDDGAVIYLNGTEVGRLNLPVGEITYLTDTPNAIGETLVPIDPATSGVGWVFDAGTTLGALVDGTNVLAVEVHQDSPASSDVSFDLEFRGLATPIPEPATGALIAVGAVLWFACQYHRWNRSSCARRIPSARSSLAAKSSR